MLTRWFSDPAALAGHPVALWLAALAVGAAVCFLLMLALRLARSRLDRLAQPTGRGATGAASRVLQRDQHEPQVAGSGPAGQRRTHQVCRQQQRRQRQHHPAGAQQHA